MVTISKIAKMLGVARSTVDRALNNRGEINEETKKKILELARKLDYHPSYLGQALRTRKTKTIGVVLPSIYETFTREILRGVEEELFKEGYYLILCLSNHSQEKEKKQVEMLKSREVDGFIFFFASPGKVPISSYNYLIQIKKDGIPIVFVDRYLEGMGIDYVVVDDFGGMYKVIKYLIGLGHRKIGYVDDGSYCTAAINRLKGYKKALLDSGLKVNPETIKFLRMKSKASTFESAQQAIREFIEMQNRPTAIAALHDGVAVVCYKVIREIGLRVPEDISLVGFGNSPESYLLETPLTTVTQPAYEMGKRAAQVLLRQTKEGKGLKTQGIILGTEIIVRESTAPPLEKMTGGLHP